MIKWDPAGSILASCGDDELVYLWSPKQSEPVKLLKDHTHHVNTLRWSNSVKGGIPGVSVPILASAGLDQLIKLWDVEIGKALMSLHGHR